MGRAFSLSLNNLINYYFNLDFTFKTDCFFYQSTHFSAQVQNMLISFRKMFLINR